MIYLDTSFVLPLFIHETASEKVTAILQQTSVEELAVSVWTQTEFTGALARRVRMGDISPETADTAIGHFARTIEESFDILIPHWEDFETATRLLQNYQSGLRTGDALHLALVLNYKATMLYTLDNKLAEIATGLNIVVNTPV